MMLHRIEIAEESGQSAEAVLREILEEAEKKKGLVT